MISTIYIADIPYDIDYDAKITAPAIPEQGPTYSSGGEPACPFEYEAHIVGFKRHGDSEYLALPAWLTKVLESWLDNSDEVYEQVKDYHA